ncbi:MAG: glycosyltransferase family 9 protein [Limisphaerales bacterium]
MSVAAIIQPRRILVRGVNWLGDAVMTTPALLRLREKFPQAHIALLTPEKLCGLWLNHPTVDETISFATGESVFAIGKKLRAGKFDLALLLPNSPRSAIEVYLGGIPQRLGYARPWRNFFLTQSVRSRTGAVKMRKRSESEIRQLVSQNPESRIQNPEIAKTAHQIFEYLHLTTALGANPEPLAPQLSVTPDEMEAAKTKFGLEKISGPVFGLNPGAEYGPAKRWPVEKFIAAAKEIQQRTNCAWILFGGKGDVELTSRVGAAIQDPRFMVRDLAGENFIARVDGPAKTLPRHADQRHRANACGGGLGNAGDGAVRQHVTGTDRPGPAGRCAASTAEIRRALLALFFA